MSKDGGVRPAQEVRAGEVVRIGTDLLRVVVADHHKGVGQASGYMLLKLRSLATGHATERRFRSDEKVESLPLSTENMEFLFSDGDVFTFMNVATFEQVELHATVLGAFRRYLTENRPVVVEFWEGTPIAVQTPPFVTLKVAWAAPGVRGDTEAAFKPATLENGMEVQVPQFIGAGDRVKVDVATGRYMERVREK